MMLYAIASTMSVIIYFGIFFFNKKLTKWNRINLFISTLLVASHFLTTGGKVQLVLLPIAMFFGITVQIMNAKNKLNDKDLLIYFSVYAQYAYLMWMFFISNWAVQLD